MKYIQTHSTLTLPLVQQENLLVVGNCSVSSQ